MDIALLIANVSAVALLVGFVTIYHLRAEWWRSPHGRSIVAMKVAVLAVALGGLCRRADMQSLADGVILIGWVAVSVVMAWRTRMLWRDTRPETEPTDTTGKDT